MKPFKVYPLLPVEAVVTRKTVTLSELAGVALTVTNHFSTPDEKSSLLLTVLWPDGSDGSVSTIRELLLLRTQTLGEKIITNPALDDVARLPTMPSNIDKLQAVGQAGIGLVVSKWLQMN
jgi:hypothetical protein